ncbi:MAG: HDOD domain-containing protein [Magnetococcales bacterium]|nr:HDOD domain-containing protein [Magnetococcales bacterium]MBF0156851.1 HDOD domain-containing protein [Magnetococcales bacterium]
MGKLEKQFVEMVEGMPAFPQNVYRVLQLTSDINCKPKELVRVIDSDPVLTVNILKAINSPYFGLTRSISSIRQAMVFVGVNTVKNLALTVAPLEMLPESDRNDHFLNDLLLHSLCTASIARGLARKMGVEEVEANDYFVAGLLHDYGKVVFARFMQEKFQAAMQRASRDRMPLEQAELEIIGIDHAEIGAQLVTRWNLPEELAQCIRSHHHSVAEAGRSLLDDCVHLANRASRKLGYGHSGNPSCELVVPEPIRSLLGQNIESVLVSLGDVVGEMEKNQLLLRS